MWKWDAMRDGRGGGEGSGWGGAARLAALDCASQAAQRLVMVADELLLRRGGGWPVQCPCYDDVAQRPESAMDRRTPACYVYLSATQREVAAGGPQWQCTLLSAWRWGLVGTAVRDCGRDVM